MKKISCFCVALLLGAVTFGQSSKGFIIKGSLSGLKDGTCLYLIRNLPEDNDLPDTVARTLSKGEQFLFRGLVSYEGEMHYIKIDTQQTKYSEVLNEYIRLAVDNSVIEIKGDIHNLSISKIGVKGSASHNDVYRYWKTVKIDEINNLIGQGKKLRIKNDIADSTTLREIIKKITLLKNASDSSAKEWIKRNPNSLITPWVIRNKLINDTPGLISAYNLLTERVKTGKNGRDLKFILDRIHALSKIQIGMIAPDFITTTLRGEKLSLSEVVKQGKITLIDFWASWCIPCRESFPGLKNLYAEYHSKGLTVLGVSTDHSMIAWEKALMEEQLPWLNVCLKEKALALYAITAIPTQFLVDNTGRIIAKWDGAEKEEIEKRIIEALNN